MKPLVTKPISILTAFLLGALLATSLEAASPAASWQLIEQHGDVPPPVWEAGASFSLASGLAVADSPGKKEDFAGNYFASLPERAEILQLHQDGTAGMTLSDEVTAGAGGFTFSDRGRLRQR
jgi:hypothetical protein